MPEVQRVMTPLVESDIKLEPATPPALPLYARIQRSWSMLFGRRENTLQPIYADRAGMLGVVALDLNGWTKVYDAGMAQSWTDLGRIVDLVMVTAVSPHSFAPTLQFGMVTGTAIYRVVPTAVGPIYVGISEYVLSTYVVHARVRWYEGTVNYETIGRVVAYTAPDR